MKIFASFLLCVFCLTGNLFSQINPALLQLNGYKYLVIKEDNVVSQYKDTIAKKVREILKGCNLPEPLDQSVLYSDKFDQCQIITMVYTITNPSYSSSEVTCSFQFVDCKYTTVFSNTIKEKQPFHNEKNYIKTLLKCFSALDGYQYKNTSTSGNITAQENTTTTEEQPQYRGSGDPMKGLNIANKPKDMVIGKYYALIIGIDNYKGVWHPLKNAVNDAKAIETIFSKYKFDVVHTLYNEQATRDKVISEFEWLVANVKEGDNVLIYFSGHGEFKQELNKGFWIPVDAETASTSKYVSNNDIQTFLSGIKSKHTLLISDACFSGDLFRGATVSIPFEESDKYYREVHSRASRQAMTSGGLEPVMDGGKDGHSVFAYYFLKTLTENQSKYFDASQVYEKIKIPVINNSEQTPKLAPVKGSGDEGGQFLFIRK